MKSPYIAAIGATLLSAAFMFVPSSSAQQTNQQQNHQQNQQQNAQRDQLQNSQQDLQQKDVTTFRGKISQKYSKFYLEVSVTHNSYELDDSRMAKLFLGKTVRVTGTLDEDKNMIRVKTIASAG
jgi:hemolysin activation/secretion protein